MVKRKWSMFRYDYVNAISKQWWVYLLLLIVPWIYCNGTYQYGLSMQRLHILQEMPGVYDLYLMLFQGVSPFQPFIGDSFVVPLHWITIGLLIVYTVSGYAGEDLRGTGQIAMLFSRERKTWIVGKMVWVILQILMDFVFIFIGCFSYSAFRGLPVNLTPNQNFWQNAYSDFAGKDYEIYLVTTVLLPILAFISIGAVEMLLSVLFQPSVSMFTASLILVVSAFGKGVFLLGNHSMWIRMSNYSEDGLDYLTCMLLDGLILIGTFSLFYTYVCRKDLLNLER